VRVLIVNYRYFVSSGPERYMFSLTPLLEARGHTVVPFSIRYAQNRESEWSRYWADPIAGEDEVLLEDHTWTLSSVARTVERSVYSPRVEQQLRLLVDAASPDIALVLQYLRKLSPSVLVALKRAGIPIVARLSDYAMVCPGLHLMRDGADCEECVGRSVWPSVAHGCVRGSRLASLVNAFATQYHRSQHYFDLIDLFITPSAVLREALVHAGFDPARVRHVPTFVRPCGSPIAVKREGMIVYAGRFDPVKGIEVLCRAVAELKTMDRHSGVRLCLFGDSDNSYGRSIRELVTTLGIEEFVDFPGFADAATLSAKLRSSSLSVVPSISVENMPNSLLESLACGTPVVASDTASLRPLLEGTGAGVLFEPGNVDALAAALDGLLGDSARLEDMGRAATELAETKYSPVTHVDSLLEVFESLLAGTRR
jgi:glycosyltransferase involved in cell wall biosynthesis